MQIIQLRRALISVSDKTGLAEFAKSLATSGIEIFSTGGTRKFLESHGIAVRDVSAYTGFPEMMDGRLKTLHPKIFGGILCRHDRQDDMTAIEDFEIVPFELVVVNLYPFEKTVARAEVTDAEAIEQIDIGGPSLVRAAAKNHAFVAIATGPHQYQEITDEVAKRGGSSLELRRQLAGQAFAHTASYDRAIADYFARNAPSSSPNRTEDFPTALQLSWRRETELRYGENPHQRAAVYRQPESKGANVVSAEKLHGKELSYNNLLDLDSALTIARSLPKSAAVVIKHNNPCGAASATTLREAVELAMNGDPVSAFGSVLGFNKTVDVATAEFLATPGLFVEAIVAPEFDPAAITVLTTKPKWKNNVRLLQAGSLAAPADTRQVRFIEGGVLVQDADTAEDPESEWKVVTETSPTDEQLGSLRFAWAVVRHVKSNAIVLAQSQAICGVGAGQMSRVDSVEISIRKAGERARGAVLASDAFFPFPDSIHQAAAAGVVAIIQPGGSVKDSDVIAACNQHRLAMIFTGRRHFKH
jgi:phosphoribosylaminoimidazolecarboxamide formyltransferase/IMP cyclohydrolase